MKDIKWLLDKPIAHRGLHTAELPENSLGAFQNAVDKGYPIELDVHLTDDGTVVVFHDYALGRMTGKDGYICKLTSGELSEYKLLNGEKKPSEYSIPTLKEALDLIDGKVPVLVEIKNQDSVGPLEKNTALILSEYKGKYAVQAFNPFSIAYFKENMPDVPRGILSCRFTKDELRGAIKRRLLGSLRFNKVARPDFISYRAEHLPNRHVTKAGLPVLAWTVRSNEMYTQLGANADNIIFEDFTPVE